MKQTLSLVRLSLLLCALLMATAADTFGQVINPAVGGVSVDAQGLISRVSPQEIKNLAEQLTQQMGEIPAGFASEVPLRKISLKKINELICNSVQEQKSLPYEARFLGGLTSIKYIVMVPEENDVLIIGPAESWTVGAENTIIGTKTGKPILQLEDLVTMFRAMSKPRLEVITCSIDPTSEANIELEKVRRQNWQRGQERAYAVALEKAMGQNVVSIQGVTGDSRFAKVMVAADYKMKQISLEQTASPVRSIPSYISLLGNRSRSISPRFWFSADYTSLAHDSTKKVWELGGVQVRVETEDEYTDRRAGTRRATGRTDPTAERWCDAMNKNFVSLAKTDPTFAELQNCMDLALAVALIVREDMLAQTSCRVPALTDDVTLPLPKYPVPRYVDSAATTRGNVVACGGVNINPFDVVDRPKLKTALDKIAPELTTSTGETWFANVAR